MRTCRFCGYAKVDPRVCINPHCDHRPGLVQKMKCKGHSPIAVTKSHGFHGILVRSKVNIIAA